MKVTSKQSISFPKLNWGITAGDVRDLPEDDEAKEQILAHPDIEEVEEKKINSNKSKDTI